MGLSKAFKAALGWFSGVGQKRREFLLLLADCYHSDFSKRPSFLMALIVSPFSELTSFTGLSVSFYNWQPLLVVFSCCVLTLRWGMVLALCLNYICTNGVLLFC